MNKLFGTELIELDLKSEDKESAILELTRKIDNSDYLSSKSIFLQDVLKRESEGSTAVGFNVAIPHGKSSGVKKSAVAFGRSTSGIQWNPEEEELVHSVFLIAVPQEQASNEHLKILAMLSRSLMNEDFRQQLSESQNNEEVLDLFNQFIQYSSMKS